MEWYALFVETGKEEVVQKFLQLYFDHQTLLSIVPKRKIPEKKFGTVNHVLKIFFPGYVLIKTNMNTDIFYRLEKIPKSLWLVNNGPYYSRDRGIYFSKICENEIVPILQLLDERDTINYSNVYVENSRFSVISGPLQGKENIIHKIDKHKNRAKILLHFMGKETTFDVGVEVLDNRKHTVSNSSE
ncbi:antiterminator LoaP [Paenibacillus sp. SYP-B3998]|uniref:Antiterminator LoaP n=1 Tax=Paenibacillus sp. SYP-B3998 TaxID=2678564 RepID=A0A6G3ZSQ8_9BACL|nr:antiterminator LoaP [Paenibacillus sp. SYP-B3998]NEW04621.1 antiterminator LoaP [Paenibacillus sp. SYP-B3998]